MIREKSTKEDSYMTEPASTEGDNSGTTCQRRRYAEPQNPSANILPIEGYALETEM